LVVRRPTKSRIDSRYGIKGTPITKLQGSVNSFDTAVSKLAKTGDNFGSRVTVLDGQVKTLSSHINDFQGKIGTTDGAISQLSSTATNLQQAVDFLAQIRLELTDEVKAMRGLLGKVKTHFDGQTGAVSQIIQTKRG
jgi:chromosome segregation ATPase